MALLQDEVLLHPFGGIAVAVPEIGGPVMEETVLVGAEPWCGLQGLQVVAVAAGLEAPLPTAAPGGSLAPAGVQAAVAGA